MKVFQDLEILVPSSSRAEFIARIEDILKDGWSRDRKAEKQATGRGHEEFYYFICEEVGNRQESLLALMPRSQQEMYVSNIVPRKTTKLNYDQYNEILREFCENFVKPVVEEMQLSVSLTQDDETLEDWISTDSAAKLKTFSDCANKSTGSAHPLDKDRWYEFIISMVLNDDSLDSWSLKRWFVEEEDWHEEIANELAIEYEQQVGLLRYYRAK